MMLCIKTTGKPTCVFKLCMSTAMRAFHFVLIFTRSTEIKADVLQRQKNRSDLSATWVNVNGDILKQEKLE